MSEQADRWIPGTRPGMTSPHTGESRPMTFSIAARCSKSGAFGIAITSSSICVASRCAWVSPLGAVTTQNVTDPALGPAGLGLLRQGLGAGAVLDLLLAGTPDPQ